jgi:hypothetical protein
MRKPSSRKPPLRGACGFQQFLKFFESQFECDLLAGPRNDEKSKDEIVGRRSGIDLYYRYLNDADLLKRIVQIQIPLPLFGAQPSVLIAMTMSQP